MVAGVVSETGLLHVKPVAQTDGFEMAVASAVYTRSSAYIFGVLFFDDDDDDDDAHDGDDDAVTTTTIIASVMITTTTTLPPPLAE